MKQFKQGTTFKVCGHDELIKKGWKHSQKYGEYTHSQFGDTIIAKTMLKRYEGQTLTIIGNARNNWYLVKGNAFMWPVATFFDDWSNDSSDDNQDDHTCKEGVTPIDGWVICKFCGMNLIKI